MLKKIAVTGGVASGKTTVCQFFQELGATVIFADKIVHDLLKSHLKAKIIEEFGSHVVKNGQIDRKILADITFKDPQKLKKLENLIHPAVLEKIDEEYAKAKGACFVVEIPLLYEIGAEDSYDTVIAVVADEKIAKKRFVQAGFSEGEFDLRMKRQLKPEEKAGKAHFIIKNNGSLEDLRAQVIHLYKTLGSVP